MRHLTVIFLCFFIKIAAIGNSPYLSTYAEARLYTHNVNIKFEATEFSETYAQLATSFVSANDQQSCVYIRFLTGDTLARVFVIEMKKDNVIEELYQIDDDKAGNFMRISKFRPISQFDDIIKMIDNNNGDSKNWHQFFERVYYKYSLKHEGWMIGENSHDYDIQLGYDDAIGEWKSYVAPIESNTKLFVHERNADTGYAIITTANQVESVTAVNNDITVIIMNINDDTYLVKHMLHGVHVSGLLLSCSKMNADIQCVYTINHNQNVIAAYIFNDNTILSHILKIASLPSSNAKLYYDCVYDVDSGILCAEGYRIFSGYVNINELDSDNGKYGEWKMYQEDKSPTITDQTTTSFRHGILQRYFPESN